MSGASSAIGTCYHMCPVREMKWREANKLLHVFEVKNKSDKYPKVDPEKAVKQFSRSAAGKREDMPSDLRPSHVLLKTMNYLINKIIPITDVPWNVVYDFVNDRVQGIRQDITIQRIEDLNTVQIFEKCIRFYITASYILCEESSETFSQHLNRQQLQICLEKLLYLYKKFDSEYFFEFVAVFYAQSIDESE
ncbi:MCM3-associated protein, partial [Stegodyphus mimosarum]